MSCLQNSNVPGAKVKILGQVRTAYPQKNCSLCSQLSIDELNIATCWELRRFSWLQSFGLNLGSPVSS